MRRFATAQRVFVIVDHAGNRIDRPGVVRRLRRSDDGAWAKGFSTEGFGPELVEGTS